MSILYLCKNRIKHGLDCSPDKEASMSESLNLSLVVKIHNLHDDVIVKPYVHGPPFIMTSFC